MKNRFLRRALPVALLTAGVVPAMAPSAQASCSFDSVGSVTIISKTYLGRYKSYVSGTGRGPLDIGVEYSQSFTNSVSGSVEASKLAGAIGVSYEASWSSGTATTYTYHVAKNYYGRVYVSYPKWSVTEDLHWTVCGQANAWTQRVTRTYTSSKGNATYPGKYFAGESRTTYF